MKQLRGARLALLGILMLGAAVGRAVAEDTKGKWQVGFGLSYFATTDYIRSNSDVAVATTVVGEGGGLPPVTFVDPRPDQNMLNQPSVKDDFKIDFNASYGLTRWLALELSASYLNAAVGNVEYYVDDEQKFIGDGTPATSGSAASTSVCGPNLDAQCWTYNGAQSAGSHLRTNSFVPVGNITEIPLQLSAIVRFRPESPLDPYIGLGVGYTYASIQTDQEFNASGEAFSTLSVTSANKGEVTIGGTPQVQVPAPGYHPAQFEATVDSQFEYHVVGGVDYFVNDHVSVYVDARYVWNDATVNITADGAHQVYVTAFNPGRLQEIQAGSISSPNLWEDRGFTGCQNAQGGSCAGDGLFATEDSNGNGTLDLGAGEGAGRIYFYPAGPNPNDPEGRWRAADAVATFDCSSTPGNCPWIDGNRFETEDLNDTFYMDRFLIYAADVCSLPNAASNPICRPQDIRQVPQYVFPGGCNPNLSAAIPDQNDIEGCEPPTGVPSITSSGSDNESDVHLFQGGAIKLGGFSIGIGVKFTF